MSKSHKKTKEEKDREWRKKTGMPENPIVCPFCGNRSKSEKYCTSCGTEFTKEVKAVAYREKNDPRPEGLFNLSHGKTNALIGIICGILIALFVVFTQLNSATLGG